jgi:hypothetical protein
MAKFLVERELLLVSIFAWTPATGAASSTAGEQMVEYDPKIDVAKPKVGAEACASFDSPFRQ